MVHSPLHDSHIPPLQRAEDQLSLVAGGGGGLEMGNVPVAHHNGILHLVPQPAQAGAQDHGNFRHEALQLGAEIRRALPVLFHSKFHRGLLSGLSAKIGSS